jgi:uncharacterized protein with von Willebrand factor type A (vWA) domain
MLDLTPSVEARVGELAAALRAAGVRVGVGEVVAAVQALGAVDASRREDARLALRATLCAGREDLGAFDEAFDAVFGRDDGPDPVVPDPIQQLALPRAGVPGSPPPEQLRSIDEPVPVPAAWSPVALDRDKDFAAYSEAELASVRRVLVQLARRGPRRRSRRTVPTRRRRGHAPDLRRTVRASMRHAGEPLERHWRTTTDRARPLVLVLDVSGSMTPYARVLLQYVQASVAARRRVEAYAFGTTLTRMTNELRTRDPDRALERAAEAVVDWSGGTRIGDALAELNRTHGRRIGRGSVVVILSDGWDRGDPDRLAAEMARLRRASHRVVWLNPLAAHPDYEPLTRGMRAALPYTDHLLAGNSIGSLETLAAILEDL